MCHVIHTPFWNFPGAQIFWGILLFWTSKRSCHCIPGTSVSSINPKFKWFYFLLHKISSQNLSATEYTIFTMKEIRRIWSLESSCLVQLHLILCITSLKTPPLHKEVYCAVTPPHTDLPHPWESHAALAPVFHLAVLLYFYLHRSESLTFIVMYYIFSQVVWLALPAVMQKIYNSNILSRCLPLSLLSTFRSGFLWL